MSETKFTPGPWEVCAHKILANGRYLAFAAAARPINETRNEGEAWIEMRRRTDPERAASEAERQANTNLMGAAPELYEACAEFVRKVEAGEARSTQSYEQMKAALQKAQGVQS